MDKTEKKAKELTLKIREINKSTSPVKSHYRIFDSSVQAELRLSVEWQITFDYDAIHYPKNLGGDETPWDEMRTITRQFAPLCNLASGKNTLTEKININTKTGPARRAEAKNLYIIEQGQAFLAAYKKATTPAKLKKVIAKITELQAQQKALLPQLRASNSAYLAGKKNEKAELQAKNAEALKSGRFWEADKDTLKGYFHPPFDKNYLADVSEKWRACLFLECESVSYKDYNKNWRHKLSGTGAGYLCGIDDNGDEWGHHVHIHQSSDNYNNSALEGTVEQAMCNIFDILRADLEKCQRQGDLLFCPAQIPEETTMEPQATWTPRESHEITSPSLYRNGTYFKAADEITVNHTSHAKVILPAGEYRLYMSRVADPVD